LGIYCCAGSVDFTAGNGGGGFTNGDCFSRAALDCAEESADSLEAGAGVFCDRVSDRRPLGDFLLGGEGGKCVDLYGGAGDLVAVDGLVGAAISPRAEVEGSGFGLWGSGRDWSGADFSE